MDLLTVAGISKWQEGALILDDISFRIPSLHKIAIAGETGSGKSTLLKIMSGFMQPDEGEILFEGRHVDGPLERLIPGHPQIAYLSQQFELRNHYRVEEVLEYANELPGHEAERLYSLCRIDHLLKRWTSQLSGGERQRIALARLLVGAPRLLLLDEPFSNLDLIHKTILKSVIRDIGEQLSITCLLVSHDPLDTLSWADELIILKDGKIVQQNTPETIYQSPVNEYVAGLLGSYYLVGEAVSAFTPWTADLPAGKRLFLRPEDIMPGSDPANGVVATVRQVFFSGSFYQYEIITGDQVFVVPGLGRVWQPGDKVYLQLPMTRQWYL